MNRNAVIRAGAAALAACLLLAPLAAGAAMVTTDQVLAPQAAPGERARVQAFVQRADAAGQLALHGVDGTDARARVAALSDDEVHALAGRIDALPAGGNIGSFTDQQVVIVLLLLILVVLL